MLCSLSHHDTAQTSIVQAAQILLLPLHLKANNIATVCVANRICLAVLSQVRIYISYAIRVFFCTNGFTARKHRFDS